MTGYNSVYPTWFATASHVALRAMSGHVLGIRHFSTSPKGRRGLQLSMLIAFAATILLSSWALAEDGHRNHFATILVGGKKIGQVHYIVKHNEQGEVEELKTKASLAHFGIKLYDFTQHLHEQWSGGELQSMRGHTNDDGKVDEVTVKRTEKDYAASLNEKPVVLPHDAFPISLWHYAISRQTLLFDLADLRLMKVKVSEHEDAVARGGKSIPATRFDFSGDWEGKVWFDRNKQFVKAEYETSGRLVTVVMDP